MAKLVLRYWIRGHWAVVLDIPLLFESGLDVYCGVVLVVAVRDPEVQMRRLRERDAGLSEEEARGRVAAQWDVRDKAERVAARGGRGEVVWNDGGREELRGRVDGVMKRVREGRPGWWAWLLLGVPVLGVGWGVWVVLGNWWARRRWEEERRREKARL